MSNVTEKEKVNKCARERVRKYPDLIKVINDNSSTYYHFS